MQAESRRTQHNYRRHHWFAPSYYESTSARLVSQTSLRAPITSIFSEPCPRADSVIAPYRPHCVTLRFLLRLPACWPHLPHLSPAASLLLPTTPPSAWTILSRTSSTLLSHDSAGALCFSLICCIGHVNTNARPYCCPFFIPVRSPFDNFLRWADPCMVSL
ncbi:hypothetical protein BDN70DRAFT_626198 [Pholiota conissans]|uniref:Uncharacterized protein n=1 Tax=Pholiota conissans TaxID=109636 RepID=A0A9P6CL92_9AGAR|nr:hypothetical protein BDN70DRAFT_626198 [Pholiota conissans]